MDHRLDDLLGASTALAEALGLESEALKAAFLGAFDRIGDRVGDSAGDSVEGGAGEAGSEEARDESRRALAGFIGGAAHRAALLGDSERRARQTANGIRASGFAFASSLDTGTILEALLDYLNWLVPYEGASVLFIEGEAEGPSLGDGPRLRVAATREWRRAAPRGPSPEELASAQASIQRREPVQTGSGAFRRLVLPLLGPSGPLGAVLLVRETDLDFDEEQTRAAEAFAGQAAAAVRNAKLYGELKAAQEELLASYDSSIVVLSHALDLRDHETEGHSIRVATLAERLGASLGVEGAALEHLRRGALLHDIGKIGIPDTILQKPGRLDEEEMAVMRRHPDYARDLLRDIRFLAPALDVPYCHHERWNGCGYPRGLAGEAIPLAARIFAAVDVWDALVHDRPYRKAMDHGAARACLLSLSGTELDPAVVEAFLALVPD